MLPTLKTVLKRNKRIFFISVISIFLITSFPACQKEFSAEDPGIAVIDTLPGHTDSLAVYSLIPAAASCVSIVSSGTSQVGVPYTTNNYNIILVHVSSKGYWSYPATTLSGITYSGSGYFADTGTASITLYASGTPDKAGSFDYPLNINNGSCSFRNIVVPAGTPPPIDNTSAYYYKANIGGIDYNQAATGANGYIAGSELDGADDVDIGADISPEEYPYPPNTTSMVIKKGTMHDYFSADNSQFKSFFSPGDYPFSKGTNDQPFRDGDGIYIVWVDGQGNIWSTLGGTGDQANSFIKIISVTDDADPVTYYVRVKLQFSCKLYRVDTGEMKQLTNGEFVGLFGKIG